jgi:hypothetical protein
VETQQPARAGQATLDLLNEVLAVERDGMNLYRDFLEDASEELRPKLLEYAEQSRRSVLLLEYTISELGGDPADVSPGAAVANDLNGAVLSVTEAARVRRWTYRLLHLVACELRDRLVWKALESLGKQDGGRVGGGVFQTAAMAVRNEEALGAHMADRNRERIDWAPQAMRHATAGELGVEPESDHWWRRLLPR